jgi:hypothetical protein
MDGAPRIERDDHDHHRERRLRLLIRRLPERLQAAIHWLREPQRRWLRLPAGLFFIVGGCLSVLPVFGLWMLPLGLVLLGDDIPAIGRLRDALLRRIEKARPQWFEAGRT